MRSQTMATSTSKGLVRSLVGHRDHVTKCALSHDCKTAISSSQDATLRIWDLVTGHSEVIATHRAPVASCALCSETGLAISASHDGTLYLLDIKRKEIIRILNGHSGRVVDCALSADGKIAISASHDNSLRVWKTETGECSALLQGHARRVTCCAISHDGQFALSGSHDSTLRLWRTDTGECVSIMTEKAGAITCCDLSADGSVAISTCGMIIANEECDDVESPYMSISFFGSNSEGYQSDQPNFDSDRPDDSVGNIWEPVTKMIDELELDPVSLALGNSVAIWNTRDATLTGRLNEHEDSVNSCALAANGEVALSAADDGTVILWNVLTGIPVARLWTGSASVKSCALARDVSLILSADADTLRLWNVEKAVGSNDTTSSHGDNRPILTCSYDEDGKILTSFSLSEDINRWDAEACQRLSVSRARDIVTLAAMSTISKTALVAYDFPVVKQTGVFSVMNFASKSLLHIASEHEAVISGCAISQIGSLAITASYDQTLRVWDTGEGRLLKIMKGHSDIVDSCSMSYDGRGAISGANNGEVIFWDVVRGECVYLSKISSEAVPACVLSADGSIALFISGYRVLHVWDSRENMERYRIAFEHDIAPICALSPDGSLGVYAISANGIAVLDITQGKTLTCFLFDTAVRAAAIAPSGRDLAVGDVSGKVHFLRLERFVS